MLLPAPKEPPTRILPSACTAIALTVEFAFGSNESAKPVTGSSRAMRLRVCPPMVGVLMALLKVPPTRILPSPCTTMALTAEFAFGANESAAPVVASRRAMFVRVCPPMVVKLPPARTLPSACNAIV